MSRRGADVGFAVPTSEELSATPSPASTGPSRRRASLGTKTLLGLGASFAMWCALLYHANALLLRPSFAGLETSMLERDCVRAQMAIQDLATTLTSKVGDWALWDDTYEFVASRDPAYVEANLNPESMETLDLDFMVFVALDGTIVHLALRDPELGGSVDAPAVEGLLRAFPQLMQLEDAKSSLAGLLPLGDDFLALASRPIHKSDLTGDRRGVLLAGRLFDDAAIQDLARLVRLHLHLERLADGDPTPRTTRAADEIFSRIPLRGITGAPLATLVVRQSREIHRQGEEALSLLLVALLVSGALGLLTTLVGIDRVVLARLRRLRATMAEIARTGDLTKKAETAGADEIADLSSSFNDLTSRLRLTQQELLRADRARSQFLANVSHEVRTPVTALLGFVDLLHDPDLPRATHDDHVRTIRRNAQHLLTILNDLLDSAKVDSGQMTVEILPAELLPLLTDAVDLVRPGAAQKGLEVSLEVKGKLPPVVRTDPTRLRQVLGNLLGNAVKFTEHGFVRLEAEMCAPQQLRLRVVDSGIGVTPEQQLRLFTPFAQADASTNRRFGGTGLGLALSRHLARQLGGDVRLVDSLGVGSTFELTLDTGDPDDAAREARADRERTAETPAVEAPQQNTHPLAGRRILVADDAADNGRLVSYVLGKAGAEVTVVGDGRQAVDRCLAGTDGDGAFDLVIMDMQMPVLDGYGATAQLRDRGFAPPILALTANALKSDLEQCLAVGCNDYATKPIDGRSLVRRVAEMLASDEEPPA
ncbi:MAG: response regulator [Planctomycetes bacterium]|nr:response regulator [Planctomycetota bacterium]